MNRPITALPREPQCYQPGGGGVCEEEQPHMLWPDQPSERRSRQRTNECRPLVQRKRGCAPRGISVRNHVGGADRRVGAGYPSFNNTEQGECPKRIRQSAPYGGERHNNRGCDQDLATSDARREQGSVTAPRRGRRAFCEKEPTRLREAI